jgi:hypothetical protein
MLDGQKYGWGVWRVGLGFAVFYTNPVQGAFMDYIFVTEIAGDEVTQEQVERKQFWVLSYGWEED